MLESRTRSFIHNIFVAHINFNMITHIISHAHVESQIVCADLNIRIVVKLISFLFFEPIMCEICE